MYQHGAENTEEMNVRNRQQEGRRSAYMVSAGAIKLGRVAGRGRREHGCPPFQWVGMVVTVIGRLTLKLHAIVCTSPPLFEL